MITALSLAPTSGAATFDWTITNAAAGGVSVEKLVWAPRIDGDPLDAGDTGGNLETYALPRGLLVSLRGKINGTSAADYWVRRLALCAAAFPSATDPDDYAHGTLSMTPAGQSALTLPVHLQSFDAPIGIDNDGSDGPALGSYVITWRSFGYWLAGSTPTKI